MFVKITSGNTKETRRIFLTNKPGLDIIHHFFRYSWLALAFIELTFVNIIVQNFSSPWLRQHAASLTSLRQMTSHSDNALVEKP